MHAFLTGPTVAACLFACALLPDAAMAAGCRTERDAADMTAEIGAMLNADRARQGLPALQASAALQKAATRHACDMARRNYFSHDGRTGGTTRTRARRAGYRACLIAENIAIGFSDVPEAHKGWMASPGHRTNMLLRDVSHFGLGVAPPRPGAGVRSRWVLVLARPC